MRWELPNWLLWPQFAWPDRAPRAEPLPSPTVVAPYHDHQRAIPGRFGHTWGSKKARVAGFGEQTTTARANHCRVAGLRTAAGRTLPLTRSLLLGPWPSSVARAERVFADLAVSALARRRHGVIPPKGARSSSSGFTAELLACSCSNLLHGEDNVRIAPDRQPRMDERTSSARYRGDPPRPCMLGCSVASQAARWRAIRLHWISH